LPDDTGKFTGKDNYAIWSSLMTIILKLIKGYKTRVNSMSPADDSDRAEIVVYEHLCHTTSTMFIVPVSQGIVQNIIEPELPNQIWNWLYNKQYRDLAFELVSQIMNRVSLPTQFAANNLLEFVDMLESEWLHSINLSKTSQGSYCTTFMVVLIEEKAKLDFLEGWLFG